MLSLTFRFKLSGYLKLLNSYYVTIFAGLAPVLNQEIGTRQTLAGPFKIRLRNRERRRQNSAFQIHTPAGGIRQILIAC